MGGITLIFSDRKFFFPIILISLGIVFIFIAGFRGSNLDKDYEAYVYSFNHMANPLDYFVHYDQWTFFEPFFYLIPSVIKLADLPYFEVSVFVLFAILGVTAKFRGMYLLSLLVPLTLLHYFSNYFLLHEMTQIRAGVATGLFLCAIYSYYHKKWLQYFFLVFLGFMFQYSGILMLVLFIFNRSSFSLKRMITFLVIALAFAVVQADVILEYVFRINAVFIQKMTIVINSMQEDENKINVFNYAFLVNLTLTVILLFNHKKLYEKNKFTYLLLKIQVASIFVYCVFSPLSVLAFRLYEFLGIVNIITIPMLVYIFRYRIIGYSVVILYSLVLLMLNLHYAKLVKGYNLVFFT